MDRLSVKGQMIDQVDLRNVPHSGFDRSNHNYGTGRLGALIPVRLDEVYPGDRIKGKPEIVENFEPLAAPLMGSMVLKQESFFVPDIQLWRHAYKFYTGKNGFNELQPCISPREIFYIYNASFHASIWKDLDSSILGDFCKTMNEYYQFLTLATGDTSFVNFVGTSSKSAGETLLNYLKRGFESCSAILAIIYTGRKMFDLVKPIVDKSIRLVNSEEIEEISIQLDDSSISSDVKQDLVLGLARPIGQFVEDFFNYFHGPSSLFDYLGWPTPIIKHDRPAGNYTDNSIFQEVIYRNIFIFGSKDFSDIDDLFSLVPLVFAPFKAYYLVWYWNYRDQLLETDILDPEEDEFLGSTITDNVVLYCTMMRQRCWFKDTFTTALTNTGDGNLLVPVQEDKGSTGYEFYDSESHLINTTDRVQAINAGATVCKVTSGSLTYNIPMNYLHGAVQGDNITNERMSYISLDVFDRIRRLRNVVQKRLILGYEVDDVVMSSFLVRMSNVRIHIPEILGRGRSAIQINTIVNNTNTEQQIAGDRTAIAYGHCQHSEMNYFSEEWGYFITITTTMPIQSYAGGMQRLYLKTHPLDKMWPEFATMGMDAIYNTELAAIGTRLTDEQGLLVFGYQGRYYDLKSRMDEEHGRLLTDLNYLTFSREWDKDNPPKLNYAFVHCWPRLDGFVMEDPTQDVFRYDCYNAHAWERRLPVPSEYV